MKIKNVRIVGNVVLPTGNAVEMLREYHKKREVCKKKGNGMTMWCDLDNPHHVPDDIRQHLKGEYPSFTASLVAYDYPADSRIGMDRRHALRVLRKAGLLEPTLTQTILVACKTIVTGEIHKISVNNNHRRVMCPVPINPEAPTFYYFGMGFDSKGAFQKYSYNYDGEGGFGLQRKDLYFWHDAERLPEYNFPLFLGIKPS